MYQIIARKIFGTRHEREIKRINPIIDAINQREAHLKTLTHDTLRAEFAAQRQKVANGAALDDVLPDVFAMVREASVRALGMRHYDVQLVGAIVLHNGRIAEMKTGEGKTLVATLAASLNALSGKGVHVVTVNDYLAKRDSEWMGQIFRFLGLSVGTIIHDLNDQERKIAYHADITYGTNNEFGFDYLRDNMKLDPVSLVQRDLNFAIVDEVDSILIDEARTPLIISGPSEETTDKYARINKFIPALQKDVDYTIDEKSRTVVLTEESGVPKMEKALGIENLFDVAHADTFHHVNQALRAHTLFKIDIDYVVKEGKVLIVDEFTGRLMPGRRWGDGLHQAVEAKEGVPVENENQTLASITFQNYFRMYQKLSGMTGTADTEAQEFSSIYNLDVSVIPTNRPMVRKDLSDQIYKNELAKFNAVIKEIETRHATGQPILVGTISIEKSELLSQMLKRKGVRHNVLNAKQHEKEAEIVAQAGRKNAVTISTNMAGRGTDIMLGGNPEFMAKSKADPETDPQNFARFLAEFRAQTEKEHAEVVAAGGLHILGTERHESRRIDNQLRGRAGRQGDPGSSQFYLSMEDDLLRIFGSDRIQNLMERFGLEEDQPIEHPWLNRAIENAQNKVEAHNFNMRKSVLEYDDVMNRQRQAFYSWRKQVLRAEGLKELTEGLVLEEVDTLIEEFAPLQAKSKDWDFSALAHTMLETFGFSVDIAEAERQSLTREMLSQKIEHAVLEAYQRREQDLTPDIMRHFERIVSLQIMDALWKDHLLQMDHLREGIGLRGYAQKDPKLEYQKEGHELFMQMEAVIRTDVVKTLFRAQVTTERGLSEIEEREKKAREKAALQFQHGSGEPQESKPAKRKVEKVGRNDPCPCGSGKKYKKCHGDT